MLVSCCLVVFCVIRLVDLFSCFLTFLLTYFVTSSAAAIFAFACMSPRTYVFLSLIVLAECRPVMTFKLDILCTERPCLILTRARAGEAINVDFNPQMVGGELEMAIVMLV